MMDAMGLSSRLRQQGMVTAIAVIFLIAAVIFVLSQTYGITGSNSIDTTQQMNSEAAIFLAESGVERAHATISSAAQGGAYTNTTCTDLALISPPSLGGGTFQYTPPPVSDPTSCGSGTACRTCTVTVKGTVGTSSRTIRTVVSTAPTQGAEGHGDKFSLNLNPTVGGTLAFTNLAYRAKDVGGSNANVGVCTSGLNSLPSGTCTAAWNLVGTGTNNVSGMGVYSNVASAGTYTIYNELTDNSGNPAPRNYVLTGVLFYPPTGGPAISPTVGYYGKKNDTTGTSGTSGSVPSGWNCAPGDATANASVAAAMDTLVYGFSSWPASAANQLNGVTLGIQPLRQIGNMTGTQGDNLYSQIWYSYNPAHYSNSLTGATNGATFTGTLGAAFRGHASTTQLTLDSNVGANEILSPGDSIRNNAGTTLGTLGTLVSGTAGQNNAVYNYTGSTIGSNTQLKAFSNTLRLASAPSSGTLTLNDTITDSDDTTAYGTLTALSGGTINAVGSTYTLSGAASQVSSANNNMHSSGTTITLFDGSTQPSVGTAIAVSPGNGVFDSATVTGGITDTTLAVSAVTSGTLSVGDAIFGINIQPRTRITADLGGGTYTACRVITGNSCAGQNAASGAIVARAAVTSVASANSYTVSRKPTPPLSGGAQVCGGVCPFFFGNSGSNTTFNLNNITTGDDWSSGFACLSGVDPNNIVILGTIVARRISWQEVVQ